MSNYLAIATVTATLKRVLENAVTSKFLGTSTTITVGQPDPRDAATGNDGRVNIFLYQVTPNSGWRNADLPTRRADGSLSQRPQLALDLHYLLSFYGDKTKLLPEKLMGLVMKTLHTNPFLPRQLIQDTVAANEAILKGSDLADQPEFVKFSPVSLSLEESSKIWSIFFQTPYVLSTAYQGTVVLIEPNDEPVVSLPVRDRSITVDATPPAKLVSPPVIIQIHAQARTGELITAGNTLLIQGRELAKTAIASIQIANQSLTVTEQNIQDSEIHLTLPDSLAAGVKTLQIVYQNGDRSNLAKFILRPQIVSVTLQRQPRQLQLTLDLPIAKGQKVVVLLSQKTPEQSHTLSLVASEDIASGSIIEISILKQTEIKAGQYTVRVQVDGAESPSQEVTFP
ncbi:DUF4255 domain-containing protein [Nostoc parmelioides]|uniref:DUF4255 domain-containing protein n=1 Tax=Nostoc parmelioides FACHB-3921 TaxID=2692909 RepID=A0ABR8BGX5_9NOSO|nr:DUF4255 domain-containing protein [Nostoc parmelioides]MBD2253363.1 DUF4255 domain-containing protein [Nostoc parmelioides FACHB-3921]